MDTGTHVVMGIALGGIATLDPVVGSDPAMAHAVMIATLAGSQAPDIDTVLKLAFRFLPLFLMLLFCCVHS